MRIEDMSDDEVLAIANPITDIASTAIDHERHVHVRDFTERAKAAQGSLKNPCVPIA